LVAPDRYRVIVSLAADRDLTRAQMIDILLAAGYRESSATGRLSSSHPLFRRTGPDRYRLIGDDRPSVSASARQSDNAGLLIASLRPPGFSVLPARPLGPDQVNP
jgi:hypothetical protein